MLPEVGASELIVIAIVALIVVGPKDLPILLRRFGQFMAKLRGMANEFRASFDEMARQSELDDLRKEVEAMRRGQFGDTATDFNHEMRSTINEIETSMSDVGVQLHPPMSYQYDTTEAPPPPVEIVEAPKPTKPARAKTSRTKTAAATKPPAAKKTPKAKATATVEGGPKPRKRASKTVEAG